jgi:putative membrane protein
MVKAVLLALGLLLAAAHGPLAAALAAPTHTGHVGVGRGHVTQGDWQFMRQAAAAGHAAIAAGRLAASGAQSGALRDFGATLVEDHVGLNRRLSLLTLDKQVPLPSRPNPADRKALGRVKSGPPSAFDPALRQYLLTLEQQMVDSFRREADTPGADPALRAFALQWLPVLQSHVQKARRVAADALTAR